MAYSNSLTNGFAYDDNTTIRSNPGIRSFSGVLSLLSPYRPMRWITFGLDYRLWKLNPIGYHVTNLLLHVICGLLVFLVAKAIVKNTFGALAASLLFCTYPLTTEAVDNISNRNELLGTAFSLIAVYFYSKKNESKWYLLAVVPAHALALLSKEVIAISLPLLYIAYDLYFRRERESKTSLRQIAPGLAFATISVVAIGYAYFALGVSARVRDVSLFLSGNTFAVANDVLVNLSIWVRAMAKGLQLIVFPATLSADYPVPHIRTLWDGTFLVSAVIVIVFVIAVVLVAKRFRTASFGLLWVLIFLLPISNIVPIAPHFMAERYLYAPSIGFCLFVGTIITAVFRNRHRLTDYNGQGRLAVLSLAVLLVVFVAADLKRNRVWESDYTLWSRTVIQQPESPLARVNLATHLQDRERYIDAIREAEKAIDIYHTYNIDFLGADPGKRDGSRRTTDLYAIAYNNVGTSYMKLRMYKKAIPALLTAISVSPHLYWAHCNLGVSYFNDGQMDQAIDALTRAIRIDEGHPEAHLVLSYAYREKGLLDDAKRESAKAEALSERTDLR